MTTDTTVRPNNPTSGYTEEEEYVHQKLIDAGLLKRVKPRTGVSKLNRPLAATEGKPLSETLLEERR